MAMSLKLLVDKKSNKVVYGEAGKEFVDFLLGLMETPLGSILRLLSQKSLNGSLSIANVYASVGSLDLSYLQKDDLKTRILTPKSASDPDVNVKQSPVLRDLVTGGSNSYGCNYGYSSYGSQKNQEIDGYVKGAVTYMVMDDLTITPSSTISSINALNTKGVQNMGCLQEMTVQVDGTKALEMVRASFQSTTVLTDVFVPPVAAAAAKRRRA